MNRLRSDVAIVLLSGRLHEIAPCGRLEAVLAALRFIPGDTVDQAFRDGELRALLASCWEEEFREAVPVQKLREGILATRPLLIKEHAAVLGDAVEPCDVKVAVFGLLRSLRRAVHELVQPQLAQFDHKDQKR